MLRFAAMVHMCIDITACAVVPYAYVAVGLGGMGGNSGTHPGKRTTFDPAGRGGGGKNFRRGG